MLASCATKPAEQTKHPKFAYDATIFELNTRQLTPEGTFAAAEAELPKLREMGVDIIWMMPLQPSGYRNFSRQRDQVNKNNVVFIDSRRIQDDH